MPNSIKQSNMVKYNVKLESVIGLFKLINEYLFALIINNY